jgi:hypothetical protein
LGVALAAVAYASSGSSGPSSGIYGRVLLGPPCPVSLERQLCQERPLEATIAVLRAASGKPMATVRSARDGRFRKALRPGTYRLVPRPTGSADAAARTVRVPADRFVRVTVRYRSTDR